MVRPLRSKLIVVTTGISGFGLATAGHGRLDLLQVGHRLNPEHVHAARSQRGRLFGEDGRSSFLIQGAITA